MRLIGQGLKIIIFNILIIAVLGEIASLTVYAYYRGGVFYTRNVGEFSPGENPIKVLDNLFHPFFGYVHRFYKPDKPFWREGDPINLGPRPGYWVNNQGFGIVSVLGEGRQNYELFRRENENCCDLPLIPRENQLIVAVMGGSVARDFAMHSRRYGSFARALQQDPRYRNKKITVVNFAIGGYRQPQQLMILNYFLMLGQKFDIVINLDGFNEVYHGMLNHKNGVDFTFPPEEIWGEQQQHIERLNMSLTDERGIQTVYFDWAVRSYGRNADRCTLAACFVLNKLAARYYQFRSNRIVEEKGETWEKVSHFSRRPSQPNNPGGKNLILKLDQPGRLYGAIADYWANASRIMVGLGRRHGFLYVHVLQPNQHYPPGRVQELPGRNALTPKFREPVVQGYPFLVSRINDMQKAGVFAIDATVVFDLSEGEIYSDSCCHFSDKGTGILVEFVVRKITGYLNAKPKTENDERLHGTPDILPMVGIVDN